MKNGDISNESPRRLIVVIDAVAEAELITSKKLFQKESTERGPIAINAPAMSRLWKLSSDFGLSIELAAFEAEQWTQEDLDKLMDRLDRRGANPFNYAEVYDNIWEFVKDIPYRANLIGVVDKKERVAVYGSIGIELDNL